MSFEIVYNQCLIKSTASLLNNVLCAMVSRELNLNVSAACREAEATFSVSPSKGAKPNPLWGCFGGLPGPLRCSTWDSSATAGLYRGGVSRQGHCGCCKMGAVLDEASVHPEPGAAPHVLQSPRARQGFVSVTGGIIVWYLKHMYILFY